MRKSADRAIRSKSYQRNTGAVRRAARAAVAPFEGLEDRRLFSVTAHYYNDGFWGNGDGNAGRPVAPLTQIPFPNQAISVQRPGAVVTTVDTIDFDWGEGSPDPAIRGDNHSTLFVGKLLAPTTGTYEILGFGDDDTHVFVNGQLVSSDPLGHGQADPRSPEAAGRGGGAVTIDLVQNQSYDLVVLHAEQGGGSGVRLRWVLPGGDSANPVVVPAANLVNTITPVTAPTAVARDASYTNGVKIDFAEANGSELRHDLQRRQGTGEWVTVAKGFINDTSITDFTAAPNTAYQYRVVAWNLAGQAESAALAVTTPAEPGPVAGAQAYAFNDQWWKGGQPSTGTGTTVVVGRSPDWVEQAGAVGDDENWGDGNASPGSIEPGVIRFDNHSTVFTGKIRTPAGEAGQYTLLAFTDDDSYFWVNGQLVSADPGGHGIPGNDPAGIATIDVRNPITLAANTDYNFVAVQSEGGGGSGIILRWITPTMAADAAANGVEAIPVDIPLDAYVSNRPDVPAAPGALSATAIDVNTFQLNWADNSTSEVRYSLQRSTSADFANATETLLPINATSYIDTGLTAGTQYFYRLVAENFRGSSAAVSGNFTTPNASQIPTAPTNLVAYNLGNRNRITFTDNAVNEAGYIVERRLASEPATAFAAVTGSPFAGNATNETGTLTYEDTTGVVAGQTYVYRVRAVTVDGVQSANSNEATTVAAGLRGTFYDPGSAFATRNFWNDADNAADPVVRVDGPINFQYGDEGGGTAVAPAPGIGTNTFAVVWEGFVQIDTAGDYTFYGESDDGIRVFIDGQLVVDGAWVDRGSTETAGTPITLTAGKHEIRVQYYENGGGAATVVRYESVGAGVAKQVIPIGKLSPADATNPLRAPLSVTGASTVGDSIVVTWIDNSASETGFRVERSTDGTTFTPAGTVPANQSAFIDDEGITQGTTYFYRVVALGATANSAPSDVSSGTNPFEAVGPAVNFANFSATATQDQFTLNRGGDATATAPKGEFINGRLRLTSGGTVPAGEVNPNNGAIATAFLTTPRHVDGFTSSFDFVLGEGGAQSGNPADGFAFIIQAAETTGFQVGPTAIGGGGGALGYQGIGNSIAVKFDLYNNINQTGLYFNGEAISDDPAFARNRVIPAQFDLNGGTPLRATLSYNPTTKVLTQTIDDIGNAATAAFTTTYNVDIPAIIGNTSAFVGFGGATGGENAQQEILSFAFDPTAPVGIPPVAEVYVRGSTWAGNDNNAANVTFKEFLEAQGLGDDEYGYRLSAAPTNAETVSWINANQIVLRYSGPIGTAGIPTPGTVVVDGVRQDYTVTAVEALDDRTVVLTLDRPLGNIPGGGIDGDRVRLTVRGAGVAGADFVQNINVLQGDASRDALGRVNAGDQGYVKSRLNRTTNAPTSGTQAAYTVFADVNADGRVNAVDQGAVKSRINDGMPAAPAAAGTLVGVASVTEDMFSTASVL